MTINRKICPVGLKTNSGRTMRKIDYITIHNTGNYSAAATSKMHADYQYAGSDGRQASWHYSVDNKEIWQSFEDNQECWHAGDGSGSGNTTSVGIEICVNDKAGFKKACDNAAWLVSELLKKYGLSIDKVVQHNKWSGKDCPSELRSGAWGVTWDTFMALVKQYMGLPHADAAPQETICFDLFGENLVDIPGHLKDGHSYVQARALLEAMGFIVGWENGTVTVRVKRAISDADYTCLCKIAEAEAEGEDEKGKVLVANVIFNRTANKQFPNTIQDVVSQEQQFEPMRNGAYDKAVPSNATKLAVDKALAGVDYSQGATFFRTIKGAAADCWHETALTRLFDHGGHRFYK